jgi:hypothetical protein
VRRARWIAATTSVALACGASCLPGDERPEPAELTVMVEATESTQAPFVTADGWTITIERFLTAVGDIELQGENGWDGEETCSEYSETNYERLFDFVVASREKVGLVYGLGDCIVEARLQSPSDDPVIGTGATIEDAERMRLRATDDYAEDERATLYVVGFATQGDRTVRFEWTFRHGFELDRCLDANAVAEGFTLSLEGGETHEVSLQIRAEELFRKSAADASALHFDRFAAADEAGDVDGTVTLEELAEVDPPEADVPPEELPYREDDDDERVLEPPETMADLVYEHLFPRVMRKANGGACAVEIRDGGRGGR